MSELYILVGFIVAILTLVSLHELGHFIVARLCGVKVLRFSVGFGKPLWTRKIRDTEWCLAPIPLGGYVKMVDTREGQVSEEDLPYAFDRQHPLKKIAIVAAGPLTNLFLAVVLYASSFSGGITEVRPWVGTVYPFSIADRSGFQEGDQITAVNGKSVANWSDAEARMVLDLDAGKVLVQVNDRDGNQVTRVIDAAKSPAAEAVARGQTSIGIFPYKLTNTIGFVSPNSPAEQAGLKQGDQLMLIDGQPWTTWIDWVGKIQASAGQKITITYLRDGHTEVAYIRPDSVKKDNQIIGHVGMSAQPDKEWSNKVQYHFMPTVSEAISKAAHHTWQYSVLTVEFVVKLLFNQASVSHISGPLTIADIAGKSMALGWQSYLNFLALVSVSLGVMNLLPIPVLDGGHLLFYLIEWVRGRPLSERVQQGSLKFGIWVMLSLMIVAFFNDIVRLLG